MGESQSFFSLHSFFFQLLIVIIRTLYEVDVEKQVIPILTLIPAEPLINATFLPL